MVWSNFALGHIGHCHEYGGDLGGGSLKIFPSFSLVISEISEMFNS